MHIENYLDPISGGGEEELLTSLLYFSLCLEIDRKVIIRERFALDGPRQSLKWPLMSPEVARLEYECVLESTKKKMNFK